MLEGAVPVMHLSLLITASHNSCTLYRMMIVIVMIVMMIINLHPSHDDDRHRERDNPDSHHQHEHVQQLHPPMTMIVMTGDW